MFDRTALTATALKATNVGVRTGTRWLDVPSAAALDGLGQVRRGA